MPADPEFSELKSAVGYAGGDAPAIIAAAERGVAPHQIVPETLYVLPNGSVVVQSLEKYADRPKHKRGCYWPQTVGSFIDYVNAHDGPATTVWVTPNEGHIEAVLNDHGAEPGWGDHRAILDLIQSPEWKFWMNHDGQMLSQVEFANHIEEGLADLLRPDGAEMLEVAQKIEGSVGAAFKSKVDLTSGEVRIAYEEKVEANAEGAAGQLAIPKTFDIGIAPFVGEDTFKLTARLRYRPNGGNLMLGYKIDRPDAAVREVLKGIYERLTEEFQAPVFFGSTPSGSRTGPSA